MRKFLLCFFLLSFCMTGINARTSTNNGITVKNLEVACSKGSIFISMYIDVSDLNLSGNQEVVLTPILVANEDSVYLTKVCIAGRSLYYRHLRNKTSDINLRNLYRVEKNEIIHYQASVPYKKWMEAAELMMSDSRCGCLNKILSEKHELLTTLNFVPKQLKQFIPEFVYMQPVITEKIREIKGSAYIDFPVNKVEINSNYRNNEVELQKISATINSVNSDSDSHITSITIKGFGSPEGSYVLNERLAKERAMALIQYLQKSYSFPVNVIHSNYEAEDWEGLRKYVENSFLEHKTEILELIDNINLTPDMKEAKIKSTYPNDYTFLLNDCYPALRHSDYLVEYFIKPYTDVEEAKQVMHRRPGNLSQHEFYMIAQSYDIGSDEYNETFEIMVHIYPDDETANLNAANVAMGRRDLVSARKFLAKAGKSEKATYARGMFAGLEGDYIAARRYLTQAAKAGMKEAAEALKQIDNLEKQ